MNVQRHLLLVFAGAWLAACARSPVAPERAVSAAVEFGEVRVTVHRDGDDLLSAGLGLAGLRAPPPAFGNADAPAAPDLRRRAIHASWRGIADLGPLGGYAEIYGAVPIVTGREYATLASLPRQRASHRVLVQVPDLFDRQKRCLVVTASSGSRGIYGAISLAGAWGLTRGCAVAYTDKGAGSGYYDVDTDTGVALDGTRAARGNELEFAAEAAGAAGEVQVKHAHSGVNPEADWGRHVLQAARIGLRMLDDAFPSEAPFTAQNTRVIATGLSNGGGAVLQAAGLDDGLIDGVVALEPNVLAGEARALYDYVTEAAVYAPCALLDARFDEVPFARIGGQPPPAWLARCAALRARGLLTAATPATQAAEALAKLHAGGWTDPVLASAASSTALDLWRSIAVTYAAAYARTGVQAMPCGYAFVNVDAGGRRESGSPAARAAWWSDASGIPPGAAVGIADAMGEGADAALPGLLCLRELWDGRGAMADRLRAGVAATRAALPRAGLPIVLVHGIEDGLVPPAFSSGPYARWLAANGRTLSHWRVAHAQHFDAFLAFPGFGERYVPMLPYAYAALDHLWSHIAAGSALPPSAVIATTPRGDGPLGAIQLGSIPGD